MDLQQEIESALPALLERVKRDQLSNIEAAFIRAATDAASKAGTQWFIDELAPELRAQLEIGKQGLVTIAADMAQKLSAEVTAAVVTQAKTTLEKGYVTQKIAEIIFRGY